MSSNSRPWHPCQVSFGQRAQVNDTNLKILLTLYLMISALFWNIRGISKSPHLRRLKKLILVHKLSVVGICEPKLLTKDMESIRVRLNFDHVISNPSGDLLVFFRFPFTSMVVGESD